jgi:hypothetical protein
MTGHTWSRKISRYLTAFIVSLKIKGSGTVVVVMPHQTYFWITLSLFHTVFSDVFCPVMTDVLIDEPASVKYCIISPQDVLKQLWPVIIPTQKDFCKLYLVTVISKQLMHIS